MRGIRSIGSLKRAVFGYAENIIERYARIDDIAHEVIGRSVLNRPIHCYAIGTGPCEALCIAGMHGNEVGTVKLAHCLLSSLKHHHQQSILVIPCLNPDGFAEACKHPDYRNGGRVGRLNAQGVDLNRNFDTNSFTVDAAWNHGREYTERTEVFAGEHGNSTPEVHSLVDLIRRKRPGAIFSFHNAGRDVFGNADALSQQLAQVYATATGYSLFSYDSWKALRQTGTLAEWCAAGGIAYLEIEGPRRWGSDWNTQRRGIDAVLSILADQQTQ